MVKRAIRRSQPASWLLIAIGLHCLVLTIRAQTTIARFSVQLDETRTYIKVTGDIQLLNSTPYLKDIYGLGNIHWSIGGKEIAVKAEKTGNLLVFSQLPSHGQAQISFEIKCKRTPGEGKLNGIYIFENGILACSGFFPGINGLENGLVDIRWNLPPSWELFSGNQGPQKYAVARDRLWAAGKAAFKTEEQLGTVIFKVVVIEGTTLSGGKESLDRINLLFKYAFQNFGPLEGEEYSLILFPKGSIGGYALTRHSLASEQQWMIPVHEILHWWSNLSAPVWLLEGVHSYVAEKMSLKFGLSNEYLFNLYLRTCLYLHQAKVHREGQILSLAESSERFPQDLKYSDIYYLGALFANGLDRAIQAQCPTASLEKVFSLVCKDRHNKFDLMDLIKKETGYDSRSFFDKYFYAKVENPEVLLK